MAGTSTPDTEAVPTLDPRGLAALALLLALAGFVAARQRTPSTAGAFRIRPRPGVRY